MYNNDNGFEGIRNGCTATQGKKQCTFHKEVENRSLLRDGWHGTPLKRVPPPVPDYSRKDSFHYASNDAILSGKLEEAHGMKNENVRTPAREKKTISTLENSRIN